MSQLSLLVIRVSFSGNRSSLHLKHDAIWQSFHCPSVHLPPTLSLPPPTNTPAKASLSLWWGTCLGKMSCALFFRSASIFLIYSPPFTLTVPLLNQQGIWHTGALGGLNHVPLWKRRRRADTPNAVRADVTDWEVCEPVELLTSLHIRERHLSWLPTCTASHAFPPPATPWLPGPCSAQPPVSQGNLPSGLALEISGWEPPRMHLQALFWLLKVSWGCLAYCNCSRIYRVLIYGT